MSHICQSANGLSWDVFLTVMGGDPAISEDNVFLGRPASLAEAALLLLTALAEQERELLEAERERIEQLEQVYCTRQIGYLNALSEVTKLEEAARGASGGASPVCWGTDWGSAKDTPLAALSHIFPVVRP